MFRGRASNMKKLDAIVLTGIISATVIGAGCLCRKHYGCTAGKCNTTDGLPNCATEFAPGQEAENPGGAEEFAPGHCIGCDRY